MLYEPTITRRKTFNKIRVKFSYEPSQLKYEIKAEMPNTLT